MLIALAGGLGLFLLGMVMMTDGLKSLAGQALRQILTRFVAGPISGIGWGAAVTALVQSSTATTVATVGFVSAGLLTYTQSVGVIFGANLGTTSTGWIVSLLGFKVSLGAWAPPIVLVGVIFRLLGNQRMAHIGGALAGFGLLFIGLDMMQSGMEGVAGRIDPSDLPGFAGGGGLVARLVLVAIGFAMTLLMQSSSASMATTLVAVSSGAIGYEQAAAMIIGQNIGTTPTAVIASIGGPMAAKRTVAVHVMFNVVTAAVAFFVLPLLLAAVAWGASAVDSSDSLTHLALFHTVFNILGISILLPVIGPFARTIERYLPDRTQKPTKFLAPALSTVGPVAQEAARRSMALILAEALRIADQVVSTGCVTTRNRFDLDEAARGVGEARRFVYVLAQRSQSSIETEQHAALMHAADHLDRLISDLQYPPPQTGAGCILIESPLAEEVSRIRSSIAEVTPILLSSGNEGQAGEGFTQAVEGLASLSKAIAAKRKSQRHAMLKQAATGQVDPESADARIEGWLWLDGVMFQVWRSARYLDEALPDDQNPDI